MVVVVAVEGVGVGVVNFDEIHYFFFLLVGREKATKR